MGIREEIAEKLWDYLGNDVEEDTQTQLLLEILVIVEKYMAFGVVEG